MRLCCCFFFCCCCFCCCWCSSCDGHAAAGELCAPCPPSPAHPSPAPIGRPLCRKLLQRLLLRVLGASGSKGPEGVAMERCHALMQDRNGSHLMEVRTAAAAVCALLLRRVCC